MALDDFNRADESPLNPATWIQTSASGGLQILTLLCAAGVLNVTCQECWSSAFGADCYVEIVVTTRPATGNVVLLHLRGTTTNEATRAGYRMVWSRGGNCLIQRENGNNTVTTIATAVGPAFSDGDTVRFTAEGATLTVTRNGTSVVTVNESTYTAGGYIGLGCSNGGTNITRLDTFDGGTLGTVVGQTITHLTGRGAGW